MSIVQPKTHLRAFTERMHRLLTNDLKAIPEDKQNVSPGGSARTPLNIVAECALVNGRIADYLSTGAPVARLTPEERATRLSAFDTEQKALAFLDGETQRLLEAIDALDEDGLGVISNEPLGRPSTRFAVAELPAAHMMYHDGQLGYIQTLHGDVQSHWG